MSKNYMDVLMDFLELPLGNANPVLDKFASIPGAIRRGTGLEQFVYVEGTRKNRVLLVAHADTFWDAHYNRISSPKQSIEIANGIIRNREGGLGADDRAGCAMVWLLRDLGHSLLITNGEEKRSLGGKWLMGSNPDLADKINATHQFAVQLDRRNATDFKCYKVGTKSFKAYVKKNTGYSEPDRERSTDIVILCRDICGVNLSIGYYNEHTDDEYLVVEEWVNTLNICRRWLSGIDLPRFCRE